MVHFVPRPVFLGTVTAGLFLVATIHRYADEWGWYLKDGAGFFRYRIDFAGQQMIAAAHLADGAEVPPDLLKQLRNGHLRRVTFPDTPPLLPEFPFGP